MKIAAMVLLVGAVLSAPPTLAQPLAGPNWNLSGGVAEQAGVPKLGLIAGWTRAQPLWQGDAWRLRLRHGLKLAAWQAPYTCDLLELGYSPVPRLERPLAGGHERVLFAEALIGACLLSRTRVSAEHALGSAFQFSDMLGVGLQWGREARSVLGQRCQHLSNLGIRRPNLGMDFLQLYYTRRFLKSGAGRPQRGS